jgi:hypothetical protein
MDGLPAAPVPVVPADDHVDPSNREASPRWSRARQKPVVGQSTAPRELPGETGTGDDQPMPGAVVVVDPLAAVERVVAAVVVVAEALRAPEQPPRTRAAARVSTEADRAVRRRGSVT